MRTTSAAPAFILQTAGFPWETNGFVNFKISFPVEVGVDSDHFDALLPGSERHPEEPAV